MAASRRFSDQTIAAIPLTVGPTAGEDSACAVAFSGLRAGLSETHGSDEQERTIVSPSQAFPLFTNRVEEQNRNRDFTTLTGSLDLSLVFERASTAFTHGREPAATVRLRLRLRIPS